MQRKLGNEGCVNPNMLKNFRFDDVKPDKCQLSVSL